MLKKLFISFCFSLTLITALNICGNYPQVSAENQNAIYVSPTGNDSASGTIDAPVRTLQRAKDMAVMRVSSATLDIDIIIRGGVYNVGSGFKLNVNDSGKENARINFKAYEGEEVRFTNALSIDTSKFKVVTDKETLKRISESAQGQIYYVNLQDLGIVDYGTISNVGQAHLNEPGSRALSVDGEWYQLARWPNAGYATIEDVINVPTGMKFTYSENKGNHWATATEPWVHAFWYYMWSDESLPIQEIDCFNKTISTASRHAYGLRADKKYYLYNLLEEIDIPGEWFLDSETGLLYIYPKDDLANSKMQFTPYTTSLLVADGLKYVNFEGIIFEDTRGIGVELNECESVVLDRCEIRNIGQQAMHISGFNNGIKNSYIHDLGNGGIWFEGGDYTTFKHGNNFVKNCHIERFSSASRSYAGAVKMDGVGDIASHNRVNNGEHSAFGFMGIDNVMEYNEVYNALKYSDDMGVFYVCRSWVHGGNQIRYNYIHDCAGDRAEGVLPFTHAIYLDDSFAGTTIYGNVIENMYGGVFGHYARYTTVKNNVFIGGDKAILFNSESADGPDILEPKYEKISKAYAEGGIEAVRALGYLQDGHFEQVKKAMEQGWEARVKKFPWLKNVFNDRPLSSYQNDLSGNIISAYTTAIDTANDEAVLPYNTIENNYSTDELISISDIPEVSKNVPGFEPIDFENIGIENEAKRQVGEFRALGPANNSSEIVPETVALVWEPSDGANQYLLTVAEDANFEKIVLKEVLISNYRMMKKLKGNGQKYYWKVEASSTSKFYDKTPVANSNGVQSFRTQLKEELDKARLNSVIKNSWKYYNDAVEEKDGGPYNNGAKDAFKLRIDTAEAINNSARNTLSPYISLQTTIDATTVDLENYHTHFINSRVPETVDVGPMLVANDWSKPDFITNKTLQVSGEGAVGYTAKLFESYKKLKFKAIFRMDNNAGGWSSVGLRAVDPRVAPWSTPCYIFLVYPDIIELQKFGARTDAGNLYLKTPNEYIKDGVEHEIEFGAVNDGVGVRITLIVDGKEVYNYLDEIEPITNPGFLSIFNAGNASVIIKSAE